jgi:hypothetical protein
LEILLPGAWDVAFGGSLQSTSCSLHISDAYGPNVMWCSNTQPWGMTIREIVWIKIQSLTFQLTPWQWLMIKQWGGRFLDNEDYFALHQDGHVSSS